MNLQVGDIVQEKKPAPHSTVRQYGRILEIEPGPATGRVRIWSHWVDDIQHIDTEGEETWLEANEVELVKAIDPIEALMRQIGYAPSSFNG